MSVARWPLQQACCMLHAACCMLHGCLLHVASTLWGGRYAVSVHAGPDPSQCELSGKGLSKAVVGMQVRPS
jgi:hypothetical protein